MSWQRYPNANYPEGYAEANMIKSTDVSVNTDGGLLSITEAGAGFGPLLEVTGADVKGVNIHDTSITSQVTPTKPGPDTKSVVEEVATEVDAE